MEQYFKIPKYSVLMIKCTEIAKIVTLKKNSYNFCLLCDFDYSFKQN